MRRVDVNLMMINLRPGDISMWETQFISIYDPSTWYCFALPQLEIIYFPILIAHTSFAVLSVECATKKEKGWVASDVSDCDGTRLLFHVDGKCEKKQWRGYAAYRVPKDVVERWSSISKTYDDGLRKSNYFNWKCLHCFKGWKLFLMKFQNFLMKFSERDTHICWGWRNFKESFVSAEKAVLDDGHDRFLSICMNH